MAGSGLIAVGMGWEGWGHGSHGCLAEWGRQSTRRRTGICMYVRTPAFSAVAPRPLPRVPHSTAQWMHAADSDQSLLMRGPAMLILPCSSCPAEPGHGDGTYVLLRRGVSVHACMHV